MDEDLPVSILSGAHALAGSGSQTTPLTALSEQEEKLSGDENLRLSGGFVASGDSSGLALCWTVYYQTVLRLHDTTARRALAQWSFGDPFFQFSGVLSSPGVTSPAIITSVVTVADPACWNGARYLAVLLESRDERQLAGKLVIIDLARLRIHRIVGFPKLTPYRLQCQAVHLLDDPAQGEEPVAILAGLSSPHNEHLVWLRVAMSARHSRARPLYPTFTDDDFDEEIAPVRFVGASSSRHGGEQLPLVNDASEAGHANAFTGFPLTTDVFSTLDVAGSVERISYINRRREHPPLLLLVLRTELLVYAIGTTGDLRPLHVESPPLSQLASGSSRSSGADVSVVGAVPVTSAYEHEQQHLWLVFRRADAMIVAVLLGFGFTAALHLSFHRVSSRIRVNNGSEPAAPVSPLVSCQSLCSAFLWLTFANGFTWISFYPDSYSYGSPDSCASLILLPPFEGKSRQRTLLAAHSETAFLLDRSVPLRPAGRASQVAGPSPTEAQLELIFLSTDRRLHRHRVGTKGAGVQAEYQARRAIAKIARFSSTRDLFELLDGLLAAGRVSTIIGCLSTPPPDSEGVLWQPLILQWAWDHAFLRIQEELKDDYEAVFDATVGSNRALPIVLSEHFGRLALLHSVLQALRSTNTSDEGARNLAEQHGELLRESQLLEIVMWLVDAGLPTNVRVFEGPCQFLSYLFVDCGFDASDAAAVQGIPLKDFLLNYFYRVDTALVDAKRALVLYLLHSPEASTANGGQLDDFGLPIFDDDDDDRSRIASFSASFFVSPSAQAYVRALWALDQDRVAEAFASLQSVELALDTSILFAILDHMNRKGRFANALSLWREHRCGSPNDEAHARILLDTLLGNKLYLEALNTRRWLNDFLTKESEQRQLFEYFVERTMEQATQFELLSMPFDPQEEEWLARIFESRAASDHLPVYHFLRGNAHVAAAFDPATVSETVARAIVALRSLTKAASLATPDVPRRLAPPPEAAATSDATIDVGSRSINAAGQPRTPAREQRSFSMNSSTPLKDLSSSQRGQTVLDLEVSPVHAPAQPFSPIRLRSGKRVTETPTVGRTPRRSSRLAAQQTRADSSILSTLRESPVPTGTRLRTTGKLRPKIAQVK